MTVLTAVDPAVTSLREIVYPVAPGDALKTNAGVSRTPVPVGLIAVGAIGVTAMGVVTVCTADSAGAPDNTVLTLLTA